MTAKEVLVAGPHSYLIFTKPTFLSSLLYTVTILCYIAASWSHFSLIHYLFPSVLIRIQALLIPSIHQPFPATFSLARQLTGVPHC